MTAQTSCIVIVCWWSIGKHHLWIPLYSKYYDQDSQIYSRKRKISPQTKRTSDYPNVEFQLLTSLMLCRYGKLFCIFLNYAKQEVILYQLSREIVIKRSSINVHTGSAVAVQVIDNLLIIHNIESKVCCAYFQFSYALYLGCFNFRYQRPRCRFSRSCSTSYGHIHSRRQKRIRFM